MSDHLVDPRFSLHVLQHVRVLPGFFLVDHLNGHLNTHTETHTGLPLFATLRLLVVGRWNDGPQRLPARTLFKRTESEQAWTGGGWINQWFLGAVPLLATAPTGHDGQVCRTNLPSFGTVTIGLRLNCLLIQFNSVLCPERDDSSETNLKSRFTSTLTTLERASTVLRRVGTGQFTPRTWIPGNLPQVFFPTHPPTVRVSSRVDLRHFIKDLSAALTKGLLCASAVVFKYLQTSPPRVWACPG